MAKRGVRSVFTAAVGFFVLFIVFAILSPEFRGGGNIMNLLRQIAPIWIIGMGQAFVLITGQIDLSVGSVVGMSLMTAGTLMSHAINPVLAILVALVLSLAFGLINGVLVAKIGMPSFIATLGTMTIARGMAQLVNNNRNTDFIGEDAQWFRDALYYKDFLFIYTTVWIALIVWIILNYILSSTKTGRHFYAIGSNMDAAKLSGVNSFAVILKAYLISSFCSFLCGMVLLASAGMGTMDAGGTYELYSIAACVIGGISTLGGTGILGGVIAGAGIWGILQNGLQFVGAPVALRNIIVGIIVIAAVLLDIGSRSGSGRKKKDKKTDA